MNIIEKKINEIFPYERNPRRNDKAVRYVANSIKEFGFKVPIIIDSNNTIVCGHTRYKAAKKLKMKTVPCIVANDLSKEQIDAFRLADNKVSEIADWDMAALNFEIGNLNTFFDFSDFGFDFHEEDKEPIKTQQDDYEINENEKTYVHKGDIYLLGNHRLMCGDSTNASDVEKLMNNEHAKILFTSPPYSNLRTYNDGKNLDVDNIAKFISTYKDYCDVECVNLGLKFVDKEVDMYWNKYIEIAHESGMKLLAWNVWDKTMVGSIGMQKHMFPVRHEWIFVFGKDEIEANKIWEKRDKKRRNTKIGRLVRQPDGSTKRSTYGDTSHKYKSMESVIACIPELGKIREHHPAVFPVELPAQYIQALTGENDIVIESFGGSGTTLIACEQTNRKCYCMELDEKYCSVIIDRWEKFTKRKAVKLNG